MLQSKSIRLTVGMLLAAASATAMAQQAPATNGQSQASQTQPANGDALQEVTVTAQMRKQNVQDTPIAITAVNAAMLDQRNETELSDVTAQAPGVTLLPTGGAFGPGMSASIRGVGQADFDPAMSPGVGLYIDDVYYSNLTGADFDLVDLDRVEILRGPQGTLAGMNSEGGAIKLYSQKPTGSDTGSITAGYGSRSLVDLRGMADVSLIQDTLFMRVSVVSRKQDGYVQLIDYGCSHPGSGVATNAAGGNCVNGSEGATDYSGGRVALRWLASDNLEFNLTADGTSDNSGSAAVTLLKVNSNNLYNIPGIGSASQIAAATRTSPLNYTNAFVPSNPYQSYANFCGYGMTVGANGPTFSSSQECFAPASTSKVWGTNLTADWQISPDMALKSITAFREMNSYWTNDDDTSPTSASLGASQMRNHTLTQELRLSGKSGSWLDYTVGGFMLDQTTTYWSHQLLDYVPTASTPVTATSGPTGLPFEFVQDDPVFEKIYAAFANGTWHITDALDFNGGVRYTHQQLAYTYVRENPPAVQDTLGFDSIFYPGGLPSATYEGSKVDWRANLDYRWNDNIMTYASASTGFKGGGVNPRPFEASQVESFAPETLTSYEMGAKTDWLDHSLRLDLASFYEKYKNMQVTLLSCPAFSGGNAGEPCAAPVNGGDANIYGVEAEASYHLGGFTADASFSKQHFEYTTVNVLAGIPLSAQGQDFQPLKWSVGAQYEQPLWANATITPRLDWSYAAGFYTNANNDANSFNAGHQELNGRITYKNGTGNWELSLIATNLTNKLWYTSVFDLTSTEGQVYGLPAPPRTFELQFKKDFK